MTYEGLLDEILGITHGFITVDAELIADDDGPNSANSNRPAQVSVPLNSNDKLYAEVRDYHVERLGMNLQQQAREIRERYDEFRKNRDASISEIREFVKRIPGLKQNYQSLQQHINLAELIKKTTDSKSFRDLKDAENLVLTGIRFSSSWRSGSVSRSRCLACCASSVCNLSPRVASRPRTTRT